MNQMFTELLKKLVPVKTGIEKILIKSELFNLPGKKDLLKNLSSSSEEIIVIDVTEIEIELHPRKQKISKTTNYY